MSWSSLPVDVVVNSILLEYNNPGEIINVCRADARRFLPHLVHPRRGAALPTASQTCSTRSIDGRTILKRALIANLTRAIDRSSLCAKDVNGKRLSGVKVMSTLDDLNTSLFQQSNKAALWRNLANNTTWPFHILIGGTAVHQAALGTTWPSYDLGYNQRTITCDQLDLYVTSDDAVRVRTALMHSLGLVLTSASSGILYRDRGAIKQIEHYITPYRSSDVVTKGSEASIALHHSGNTRTCIVKVTSGWGVRQESVSKYVSRVLHPALNLIVLRDSDNHPLEKLLSSADLECHSSAYFFGGRWHIRSPRDTYFGATRINSSLYHRHLGMQNDNFLLYRSAEQYMISLGMVVNRPLEQVIDEFNEMSEEHTLWRTKPESIWYFFHIMTCPEDRRASQVFRYELDDNYPGIVMFSAKFLRAIQQARIYMIRNALRGLEREFGHVVYPSETMESVIQIHNRLITEYNLRPTEKLMRRGVRVLNCSVRDSFPIRHLPSGSSSLMDEVD